MRGEDSDVGSNGGPDRGSPPHARGRLVEAVAAILRGRITPACAGKTRWTLIAGFSESDHPRMRGEDRIYYVKRSGFAGSPPHARGRRVPAFVRRRDSRITPACAGKTTWSMVIIGCSPDHPRMRGEDQGACRSRSPCGGSPPHARGRHDVEKVRIPVDRITPACAGKTIARTAFSTLHGDHPRMRGEDMFPINVQKSILGSPPHARGRRNGEYDVHIAGRITPACAGKTQR